MTMQTIPTPYHKPQGTFVRYFGGKSGNLAAKIAAQLPPHTNYLELYGGAAGVLLNKQPSRTEIYNDLSQGMYALFLAVRDHYAELARRIELTPFSRDEWEQCMLAYQAPSWHDLDLVEKARIVYVSLEQSFNGQLKNSGWRFGGPNHDNNVAIAFYNKLEKLPAIAARMRGVLIENKPALELLKQWDSPESLFYLDPTYLPATRSNRTKGKKDYEYEMTNEDHDALLAACLSARGKIILSGYYSPVYDEPLTGAGWVRQDINCIASSALFTDANGCKGRNRKLAARVECLWFNPQARPRTLWSDL